MVMLMGMGVWLCVREDEVELLCACTCAILCSLFFLSGACCAKVWYIVAAKAKRAWKVGVSKCRLSARSMSTVVVQCSNSRRAVLEDVVWRAVGVATCDATNRQ
jgi:hypothetical protein